MVNLLINSIIFIIIFIIYNALTKDKIELKNKKTIFIITAFIISNIISFYVPNKINNIYTISLFSNISIITLYKKLIDKYKTDKENIRTNIILYLFIGITISFILELSIFNFRYYQAINYQEIPLKEIITDEKVIEENGVYRVEEPGTYDFEFTNINKKINNLYLKFIRKDTKYLGTEMTIFITDESNSEYIELSNIKVIENVEDSSYHFLHLTGKSEKIKLAINMNPGIEYSLEEISINVKKPLKISTLRIVLLTCIILLFYLFRPSSKLYQIKLFDKANNTVPILLFILFETILFSFIFLCNTKYMNGYVEYHNQYQRLAVAMTKGKIDLTYPNTELLLKLDNPYDISQRLQSEYDNSIEHAFDIAFYKGKYYVYFGVVPVLTTYLPYYVLTGKDLPNHNVCYILGILIIISFSFLLFQITKRWHKSISIGLFLLMSILFVNASGILMLIKYHDLHTIPILYSLFFSTLGLGLWISSYNQEKNQNNIFKLVLGSLCLALNAGCRPQFLIASFFIFPIFYSYFIKEGKATTRKIKELIALITPYIIIATAIMIYNYVRFESPFEFGANYNLTAYDVTNIKFSLERLFSGLYYYLIDIPNIIPIYPFIKPEEPVYSYLGFIFYEPVIGGFFIGNIICIISLFTTKLKKFIQEKSTYNIALLSIIFAFIVLIVDIEIGGIVTRYLSDFSWLITLSTVLLLIPIYTNTKTKQQKQFIVLLIFVSLIYNIGITIFEPACALNEINETLYENIKYLICFWL